MLADELPGPAAVYAVLVVRSVDVSAAELAGGWGVPVAAVSADGLAAL